MVSMFQLSHRLPLLMALIATIVLAKGQEISLFEFPVTSADAELSDSSSIYQSNPNALGKRDTPLGGGPTVLGTYYIEVKANGQKLRLQLDTGSTVTYLPSDKCQIVRAFEKMKYEGNEVVQTCSFYNKPLSLDGTHHVGCNPSSCKSCSEGCLLSSEYQDTSAVAAIARGVTMAIGDRINASSVCGLVFRSSKRFRYDRGSQIDGLIGLGYTPEGGFPTVLDSWITENNLPDVFSIQLGPRGGAFTLGGYNPKYFEGEIHWTPIIGSTHWYQVPMTSISVHGSKIKYSKAEKSSKTIVDSGTTHNLIPPETFDKMTQKITTYVLKSTSTVPQSISAPWENSFFNNALCHTDISLNWLPNLDFTFERKLSAAERKAKVSSSFTLSIEPKDYLYQLGTRDGKPCYSFGFGKGSKGLNILGDTFMTSYYSIFDRQNNRIGFAYSSKASDVIPIEKTTKIERIPEFAVAGALTASYLLYLIAVAALIIVIL